LERTRPRWRTKKASSRISVGVSPSSARARGESGLLVDENVTRLDWLSEPPAATQHSANARKKLLQRERLDEVIISAQGEAGEPVSDPIASGQEHDRQVAPGAQSLRQPEPITAWQRDVKQRQVRGSTENRPDLVALSEGDDRQAIALKRAHHRLAHRVLILHHDYARTDHQRQYPSCG